MTDNKDPQITAEMVQKWLETFSSYEDMYDGTIDATDIARAFLQQAAELSQLRAERQGLDEEALDNASTLAFYLFDQQGWDLSELSAEEIIKRIIQRYLEITKLTDSAPSNNSWQDISTAPKDGTKILAYLIDNAEHRKSFPENERNGIDIIVWTNHNKGGWISNRFGTPTHWMPLPDKSKLIDASSSKGRTPDFDSGNCGSNPQEAAKLTDSAQRGEVTWPDSVEPKCSHCGKVFAGGLGLAKHNKSGECNQQPRKDSGD